MNAGSDVALISPSINLNEDKCLQFDFLVTGDYHNLNASVDTMVPINNQPKPAEVTWDISHTLNGGNRWLKMAFQLERQTVPLTMPPQQYSAPITFTLIATPGGKAPTITYLGKFALSSGKCPTIVNPTSGPPNPPSGLGWFATLVIVLLVFGVLGVVGFFGYRYLKNDGY